MTTKKQLHWLWFSLMVIVLDQITKFLITQHLSLGEVIPITSFFNLTLAHNPGAAFSFLSKAAGWQGWLFAGIACIVSIAILIWLYRLPRHERWTASALCLVLGGALGNLIDRAMHGYVIDFIQIYYRHWYWPTFNVADSAISIGAVMLLISIIRDK